MTCRFCIGIVLGLLLVLGTAPAHAQSSAEAFFHDAAQAYVEGDLEGARRAVERGLEVAPSDPRLQALQKKLEQQTKRRGDGASRQGGNQSQNQQSRGRRSRQQRSGEAGENARSQDQESSEQRSSDASEAQSGAASQRRGSGGGQRRGRSRGALSRVQAARLLRALERQEMKLLREVQTRGQQSKAVEKDW